MSTTIGYSKIASHPDKEEIVARLLAGESIRYIEAWLRHKYPTNKKYQVSYISLQSFRKNELKLNDKVLKDLQKERRQLQLAKRDEQRHEAVQNTMAYKAGLANFVQDSLIDYNAKILDMMSAAEDGIRHLQDLNVNSSKGSHLNHQAISNYINNLQSIIKLHHDFLEKQEKKADSRLEEDYEELSRKMEILIEAVKDAFSQTNPEGLFVFLQIVRERMSAAGLRM